MSLHVRNVFIPRNENCVAVFKNYEDGVVWMVCVIRNARIAMFFLIYKYASSGVVFFKLCCQSVSARFKNCFNLFFCIFFHLFTFLKIAFTISSFVITSSTTPIVPNKIAVSMTGIPNAIILLYDAKTLTMIG